MLAALLLWFPVLRATVGFEIDYSEGWNIYWQQQAATGVPLYGASPVYTIANYPPLSFHLIGLLGRLFGNTLLTGRVVALISLALICAVAAAIVISVTASRYAGWYAALCLPVWLYVFAPERIGMDDPQLLGMLFELIGFCIWVRGPGRPRHVLVSALIFALAVFTKDTLIALPAAVATWLIVRRDWRRLALWIWAGVVTSGILGAVTVQVDGRFFLDDLLRPRAWAYLPGLGDDVLYLLMFLLSFGFAAAWSIGLTRSPRRHLLALGWLYTHLLGFVLALGNGVGLNIQFESITLDAIVVAIGLHEVIAKGIVHNRLIRWLLLGLFIAWPFLWTRIYVPTGVFHTISDWRALSHEQADFMRGVDLMKSRPDPVLCENLLLCNDAGRAFDFDAYFALDQIKTGALPECDLIALLLAQRLSAVEIGAPPDDRPPEPAARLRFTRTFMQALLERYSPVLRTSHFTILEPAYGPWPAQHSADQECHAS